MMDTFKDDIDWGVFKDQQMPKGHAKPEQSVYERQADKDPRDVPLGGDKDRGKKDHGFPFGKLAPYHKGDLMNKWATPENIKTMVNEGAGAPGMNLVGGLARTGVAQAGKKLAEKGIDYLQPGKAAEEFRSGLGQGTSKENIQELGNRVKLAKDSAKEEALIPKRELYKQEGKSNVYDVNKSNLPEGNLNKMGEMIAPGEKFGENQSKALSTAIGKYRKTGNIEAFTDHAEEIFNIAELPEKAIAKVEDALLMPTKRESAYLSDKSVADFYGKRGLKTLHDAYKEKPILANYDALQSAIKDNIRKLAKRDKAGTLDTAGEEKLEAFRHNVKNLNQDKEAFMQTLPEKMQNLENEFRHKYATGVGKFESAPLAMRKLAEGRFEEVTGAQVAKLFTNPTKETLEILKDLGPSAGKNIIYNAVQKVPMNDAEGMAKTILDLKRTKGYDHFINKEMEDWAHNMIKQVGRVGFLKKAMATVGTTAAGGLLGGPIGAGIGVAAGLGGKPAAKYLAQKFLK